MIISRALLLATAIAASIPVNNSTIYYNEVKEVQVIESNENLDYINAENIEKEPYIEDLETNDLLFIETPVETPIIEAPLEYFPVEEPRKDIILFKNFKLNLREGIVSEDVLRLKKFLHQKGYTDNPYGYYFDTILKKAVIRYQRDNGLTGDGIVGPGTFKQINEDMKANGIIISERNPYFSSKVPKGQWIFINKSSNTLYFLRGQEILGEYNVATGKTELDTPEGKFSIVVKTINPAWGGAGEYEPIKGGAPNNPLGKRWLGLSVGGGGQYGIHGNAAYNSIGKYVSMGCIRMYNEDVEYLFERVQKGTIVWIGDEYKLQEYGVNFQ